ncbi:putative bifunctional diguanylate cyclase/phosphodiesterase [Allokutzneria albata]|uniref:PAS domain S-box-containing protein/diguanylate cyclase (GGDEF) domain-containing protein n=1 Tax=Allokutzneria albata TaxID=211114 RepID=A0A1H0BMU2_ALLAB|nr:EAL domain-containing protein [Allokutzneria albata]SDN46987.1 PAS domain S-box-containing protein/diguanylate cyclase (GGDEF) domain-containing protein [Allokutzneria albata]
MTIPLPDRPLHSAELELSPEALERARVRLARKWAYLVSKTTYIPMAQQEIELRLAELVDVVIATVRTEPFSAERATDVGTRLVELNFAGRTSLRRTVEILGKSLLGMADLLRVDRLPERVVGLLGALTSGYVEAVRLSIFAQQENLNRALIKAAQDAQRNSKASEARFDEVFTSSNSGIAITDLDGAFVRTNAALSEILDYGAEEFEGLTLFDVIAPEDVTFVRNALRDLADGKAERLRQRRTMLGKDGETVQAHLAISLLRDGEDNPNHYVVIVGDDTELTLLQGQLSHQSLHDVLTGLPNRQFFTTRLERVLRHADQTFGVTMYHLDLDAFSVIANGLGGQAAEALLKSVAERLRSIFAGESAMVARLGGDEFGVLVQNEAGTPDVVRTVEQINEVLAEPLYVGGNGVASSACIGVVHRPPADIEPAELLRLADMTLRRAKRNGSRQWGVHDPEQSELDRARFGLAATMPGAWESGEVGVHSRPLVRLDGGRTVAVEVLLRWEHPELGQLPHSRCVELAEQIGLVMPLGTWLLRSACESMADRQLPLGVGLTPYQAADPDLVGEVLQVLEDTGLDPAQLQLGVPVRALLSDCGEAADNLAVLADTGIGIVLDDFGTSAADLAFMEDLPVRGIRVASSLVRLQAERTGRGSSIDRALTELVSHVHSAGIAVVVGCIDTPAQLDWWRGAGADFGLGRVFPVLS